MKNCLIAFALSFVFLVTASAQEATTVLEIDLDNPGITVSPSLYGIFFEEINLAGDGGIYPELIRNRSFEFKPDEPQFWTFGLKNGAKGNIETENNPEGSEYNRTVLKVDIDAPRGGFSVINEGYWGVPLKKGDAYILEVRTKAVDFKGEIEYALQTADGSTDIAAFKGTRPTGEWKWYKYQITATQTDPKARFAIKLSGKGTILFDYVSLKPAKTYKNHGLRIDLMEKLAALKPSFVRFPGGCWVEGDTMAEASRWKRTIGDPIDRWTQWNLWGYHSTNGLGYHEYLQMCEDLGADAMFVINCGMSHRETVPMDKMDEYVQDALDAIEYANGPADSEWGKIRAKNGHAKPFSLKYIQIGNENGGPQYWERYDLFYTKIREKYPEIKIISNEWGGRKTNKKPIEIIDEHYYNNPTFFINQAERYDNYDREGMKVYVGEYAVTQNAGLGHLNAAIGEAAFMTGMERNSDVVLLSSYAPLFVNANHRRWNPDMIVFDGTRVYGTPSYYVQQLFSVHRASTILPSKVEATVQTLKQGGAVGLGTWETQAEFKDVKIEKDGAVIFESDSSKAPEGARTTRGNWKFENGVLRQSGNSTDSRYIFGEQGWSDYMFSVKARKTGGKEGFLILFNVNDDDQWYWLNLGGWGNTSTALQSNAGGDIFGKRVDVKIENDRWYDIKIEQKGDKVKCFLDGEMILEETLPPQKARKPLYVVSGLSEKKDEVILKIVNVSDNPCKTKIALNGTEKIGKNAKLIELTADSPFEENTLDSPLKVSPAESRIAIPGPEFERIFPAKSVTVIRIPLM